jgi:hypothetical protein
LYYEVINAQGSKITSSTTGDNKKEFELDFPRRANIGVHLVRIHLNNGETITKKIIVN